MSIKSSLWKKYGFFNLIRMVANLMLLIISKILMAILNFFLGWFGNWLQRPMTMMIISIWLLSSLFGWLFCLRSSSLGFMHTGSSSEPSQRTVSENVFTLSSRESLCPDLDPLPDLELDRTDRLEDEFDNTLRGQQHHLLMQAMLLSMNIAVLKGENQYEIFLWIQGLI